MHADPLSFDETDARRTIGLTGATAVGVGAIVGGGILVLAGTAFERAGPGAILAFAFNGIIAVLTAMSFAELSTTFPQSGGAYQFAKKAISMRAAFAMGWILWFAYVVAAVLYALGFGAYTAAAIWQLRGHETAAGMPAWWVPVLGIGATVAYALLLARKAGGGGQWLTWGKVVVFVILVAAGSWALFRQPLARSGASLLPFAPRGISGILQAMGYTFIAMQGFELVSTVAGEVKQPMRTIPRAMFLSLGMALAIYLPLLFLVSTVGVPEGGRIAEMAAKEPDTIMATAARHFMGQSGYWFVMIAAVLATLTALQACVLAASRVAQVMAADRTLPRALAGLHPQRLTPVTAVVVSAGLIILLCVAIPSPGAAGAAASLIFLLSFALAHVTCLLVRLRSDGRSEGFRSPFFPAVPLAGGLACVILAVFQGIAVPAAGFVTAVWLVIGFGLYLRLFALRAEAIDAFSAARDPELMRLRGQRPLVLVPIANPESAHSLLTVAYALAPSSTGQVMLLNVIRRDAASGSGSGSSSRLAKLTETSTSLKKLVAAEALPKRIQSAQQFVFEAVSISLEAGWTPQTLMTIADDPWGEIRRVAREENCQVLLLGFSHIQDGAQINALEELIRGVDCDVAVLCAPPRWRIKSASRVLVPVGGRGGNDRLRAQLLGSLYRTAERQVEFVRVLPPGQSLEDVEAATRRLRNLAADEVPGGRAEVLQTDDVAGTLIERARASDLVLLGLRRDGENRKSFGPVALRVAAESKCPMIVISHGD